MFAARVGTGSNEKLRYSLHERMLKLKTDNCPFVNLPKSSRNQWGWGIICDGHETLHLDQTLAVAMASARSALVTRGYAPKVHHSGEILVPFRKKNFSWSSQRRNARTITTSPDRASRKGAWKRILMARSSVSPIRGWPRCGCSPPSTSCTRPSDERSQHPRMRTYTPKMRISQGKTDFIPRSCHMRQAGEIPRVLSYAFGPLCLAAPRRRQQIVGLLGRAWRGTHHRAQLMKLTIFWVVYKLLTRRSRHGIKPSNKEPRCTI